MIKNERQYRLTDAQVGRFEQALVRLRARPAADDENGRDLQRLEEEALLSQLHDLREEMRQYDALRNGEDVAIAASSLRELPRVLIQARIARGLSQRGLAERIGVKEQQIQRYEATDYAAANLGRVAEVAEALGVEVRESMTVPGRGAG
jgi:hypothetical protein